MGFLVNGHEYSFTSIRAGMGKLKGDLLSSVNYSDGLDGGKVVGGDGTTIGVTKGPYEADSSLEFHTRRHFQEFFDSLGPYPYEVFFPLVISYSESNVTPVITDTIPLCRIKKSSVDASKGNNEAIPVKVELIVGGVILWNGKPGVSQRQD